jgi:N-acetyl-alpha-D-glucosaminyl L-malate synthase BshA
VIHNFIDSAVYLPKESCKYRELFSPDGEKILVHTSNFRPVKRVTDVIRTFDLVLKQVPSRLLLIGDGPDRSESENLCRELGIFDKVRFLGKQDALADILAASDLFLLPSQSESFGLSALEAMSCGLPVISTSIGGIPEVNLHSRTGYIAEIGDVERMAKYAVELLTNEAKYRVFSEAARRRAVEVFEKNIIVPQYEAFYERILAR